MKIDEKVVNQLLSYVNDTVAFAKDQIPDVLNQIIRWKIAENGIVLGLSLAFLIVLYVGHLHVQKRLKQDKYFDCDFLYIFGVITGFIGVIVALCSLFELVKVCFAPKIYLVEFLMGLNK